jgi:hypothetical protein
VGNIPTTSKKVVLYVYFYSLGGEQRGSNRRNGQMECYPFNFTSRLERTLLKMQKNIIESVYPILGGFSISNKGTCTSKNMLAIISDYCGLY